MSSTCWPWAARRWSVNLTGISTEKNVLDQMMRRIRRSPRTSYSDKILGNMSERVRTFISEEMEFLGPMRLERGGGSSAAYRSAGAQLEEQGQVTIVRGDSDDPFV